MSDELRRLDDFLDGLFTAQDRLTNIEIQRSAIAAELPAELMTHIDSLPEGMYTQDEASEAFRTL